MATDRYLTPVEQPVFLLDCKAAFEGLTNKEKLYAHYLSQASWYGSLICLEQTSPESYPLFALLQRLFHSIESVEKLEELSVQNGVTKEEFNQFLQFVATFYGNMGNYLSFGDTKFVPRIPKDKFRKVLESSPDQTRATILQAYDTWAERIYSVDSKFLSLGLEDHGISTYYSDNIVKSDVDFIRGFMQEKGISPYNTRLWKHDHHKEISYELKIASAEPKATQQFEYKGKNVTITYGDHSAHLRRVVDNLQLALKYTANENQTHMIEKYIEHFSYGNIDDHKDSQRFWIKDINPVVETNIGFIESYRDPEGERGEFEGFVAVVNKEVSKKFSSLVEQAEKFITKLPWGKAFEKDKFLRPDFTSLEVVSFASSGVPAGINIPNYDDIRQSEGFKNVSLGNVLAARSKDPIEFIKESDQELYNHLEVKAFEVQVGIHELLGHGTGKLFQVDENGKKNFDENLLNPITNQPISSFYKPKETWDSKFQSFASTMEECRAESCGIFLSTDKELLSIFGFHPEEHDDVTYINWLSMVRNGLRGLEFYTPETRKWGQAHMQARFVILRVLLEAGQGFVTIEKTSDNIFVVLDRSKILTVGLKAISDFLLKLQVYKSTADVEGGIQFYQQYSTVPEDFLPLRDLVLSKKKPRRVFVQSHTAIVGETVQLQDYEPSAKGIIESFKARFAVSDL